jgi:hypothetical protein
MEEIACDRGHGGLLKDGADVGNLLAVKRVYYAQSLKLEGAIFNNKGVTFW